MSKARPANGAARGPDPNGFLAEASREEGALAALDAIWLGRRQLRGRNVLLGNKQGLMLHLPAANGVSPRSIHRSKWFGVSRLGRKFLEALVCTSPDGPMLSRRTQQGFVTDGIMAERSYFVDDIARERYFVPDYLPGMIWTQSGPAKLVVEPYFNMRFHRGNGPEFPYDAQVVDGALLVCRPVELTAGRDTEGADTGGIAQPTTETLWAACRVSGGEMWLRQPHQRRRPMWYSLDAARRRFLRKSAAQDTPVAEHAPKWELASGWVYSPATIETREGSTIAIGFGNSKDEALSAADTCLHQGAELEREKRERLSALLHRSWFSTGHHPTDRAYAHVLSRVADCLVVAPPANGAGETSRGVTAVVMPPAAEAATSTGRAHILAGNAYFQEAWKRDENIALGGLLASGQYRLARDIVETTWQGQDEATGRLPLRFRTGEIPGYTSSDGTLWALLRLAQYVALTGDTELLRAKLPMVAHFFRASLGQCRDGLLPSGGVAVAGHEWETWMDTEFSARSGFPVEIQLLWLSALKLYGELIDECDPALALAMRAANDQLWTSLELFRRGEYFVDHLTRELDQVDLLTPNAYFWTILGLDFDWDWEDQSLVLGRWELGGVSGIRTLARSQWETVLGPGISALARGDRPLPSLGKINYHRGVEWNWLSQLFVAGNLRHGQPNMAYDHFLARQIYDSISIAGLGGISEVFDHRGPAGPDFQTWSMTGLVEALHRFLGVSIDVPRKTITIQPHKPRRWPYIRAQKWYGSLPFQVEYLVLGGKRELSINFETLPEGITLRIELPLRNPRRPRSMTVESGGERLQVAPQTEVCERPNRAVLTLPASKWLRVRMVA